jgi:hypothetical protein
LDFLITPITTKLLSAAQPSGRVKISCTEQYQVHAALKQTEEELLIKTCSIYQLGMAHPRSSYDWKKTFVNLWRTQ